jgi:hypothetical protein
LCFEVVIGEREKERTPGGEREQEVVRVSIWRDCVNQARSLRFVFFVVVDDSGVHLAKADRRIQFRRVSSVRRLWI